MSTSQAASSYVTLSVASETYAVPVLSVNELVLLQPLTQVPMMPECIRGLMNLRGTVVPVVDLARQLGLGMTDIGPQTCVIVVDAENGGVRAPMGVLANQVDDVVMVAESDIETAPAFGSAIKASYLTGVTRVQGKYVLILDLPRILSPEELLAVVNAETGAGRA
jgi:purine-binding chemotaxis protein CheW